MQNNIFFVFFLPSTSGKPVARQSRVFQLWLKICLCEAYGMSPDFPSGLQACLKVYREAIYGCVRDNSRPCRIRHQSVHGRRKPRSRPVKVNVSPPNHPGTAWRTILDTRNAAPAWCCVSVFCFGFLQKYQIRTAVCKSSIP